MPTDIGGSGRLGTLIGGSARKNEAPVAIAAVDEALLVDLQEHARMAERRPAGNLAGPVACDAGGSDAGGFGCWLHRARRIAKRGAARNREAKAPC